MYRKSFIVISCFILLTWLFHEVIGSRLELVFMKDGILRMSDFAYHIALVRAFWFEGLVTIYRLDAQTEALKNLSNTSIVGAMPVGVTPAALFLWWPCAYLARLSISLANSVWVMLSLFVFAWGLWAAFAKVVLRKDQLVITLLVICLLSSSMFRAVLLGQTSLMSTGALMLLFVSLSHEECSKKVSWKRIVFVLLLALKPTYFLFGIGLLFAASRWKEALFSASIVLVLCLSLTPKLGFEWPIDYYASLGVYTSPVIIKAYAHSIVPHTTNVFKSAFSPFLGLKWATAITNTIYLLGSLVVLGLSLASGLGFKKIGEKAIAFVFVALYLLFSPYVGAFEDVLMIALVSFVVFKEPGICRLSFKAVLILLLAACVMNQTLFPADKAMWIFWCGKVGIIGFLWSLWPRFYDKQAAQ